jgi:hypothetical protein
MTFSKLFVSLLLWFCLFASSRLSYRFAFFFVPCTFTLFAYVSGWRNLGPSSSFNIARTVHAPFPLTRTHPIPRSRDAR